MIATSTVKLFKIDLTACNRKQALRFGAELVTADVDRVDLASNPKRVWVGGVEYSAHTIIISTGAQARMLGLESERQLLGHGVSTCATCDGFFFRGQSIAVIGGGDSALEEATFLTRFADKVTVVHRRKELRGSKIMQDRAFANPKVEFRWNSTVEEVLGNGKVDGLVLRDVETNATSELAVSGRVRRDRARPEHLALRRAARPRRRRVRRASSRARPGRRSPACSPEVTCRIARTARRSRRRAPAAWPRSRPSDTSRHSPTAASARPRPTSLEFPTKGRSQWQMES